MAGTYRRLKSGNWRAEVMIEGIRLSSTHRTKRIAEQWVGEQLLKETGEYQYTLLELLDRYASEVTTTKKGEDKELIRIDAFKEANPGLLTKQIDAIKAKDIRDHIHRRLKSVKPSTVNRELNLISAVFNQGMKWEWCRRSPVSLVKRPKDPPPRERRITPTEQEAILICLGYSESEPVTSNSHKVAVAWLLAIETAMRQGEIAQTKKVDVHLDSKTLRIPASITKTGEGRTIPLSDEAVRLIRRLPDTENERMLGVRADRISQLWRGARDKAGVRNMTFHDSRHEATTRLAQKLHVLDLARVTGHKNINELLTYYDRSAEDMADLL